ncbi:MAG: scyllo-inositol 2-dehydrogenase (NAD(+)) [Calditrichaeota bacterium]|nr:scyllo-inositol 2-dehydrogenase (NAD(+)) [Calditrichota bacterium]
MVSGRAVKTGVIGVGRLGGYHAQKYAACPGAELVGVYDADGSRAEAVARECGCRVYSEIDALLAAVDAVSVAVPTRLHHEIGVRALDAGRHVLIEKPIASSSAQARELVQWARRGTLVLQVGHIERFNPAVTALRGIDVRPKFVEAHRLAPYNPRGADVSVIHDLMIHDLDVLLHWMGHEIERVDAYGVPLVTKEVDICNAHIRFAGNKVANLTASRISKKKMRKFRMFQEDAYISVDFEKRRAEVYRRVPPGTPKALPIPGADDSSLRVLIKRTRAKKNEDALQREVDAFVTAVAANAPPLVGGVEATVALELAEEIARQAEIVAADGFG